jgi:lysozyme
MQTSQTGKAFIAKNEGDCLTLKPDTTRNQIGHGHNLTPSEQQSMIVYGINISGGITPEQADYILEQDVAKVDAAMNAQHLALELNQNQWDAVADWAYNEGVGNLITLLAHGIDQIPAQLPRWNLSQGKVLPGLVARRAAEVALFNTPV